MPGGCQGDREVTLALTGRTGSAGAVDRADDGLERRRDDVRVDPDLGDVHVSRIVAAYGAGRILNHKTARSQLVGGIMYGLGMALWEHTAIDTRSGRYLNADLAEYLVPVNADAPAIDVIFVDEKDEHVNPIGVKGIGEIGTTGVAAAVANAVYHATGVRVRDLPITLDKLMGHAA